MKCVKTEHNYFKEILIDWNSLPIAGDMKIGNKDVFKEMSIRFFYSFTEEILNRKLHFFVQWSII